MAEEKLGSVIHQLVQCGSLQDMLQMVRYRTGAGLILADLSFHVLAMTEGDGGGDARWKEIETKRMIPVNILDISIYQNAMQMKLPMCAKEASGQNIIRCPVLQSGRKMIGYLMGLLPDRDPDTEDLDLIQVLADLCGIHMTSELHYAEYPEDMVEFFISDLINGLITDENKIQDRCRFFHWNLKMPYRLLTVRRREKRDGAVLDTHRIRDRIQQEFPEATAFVYGEQVKMLVPVYDETTRDTLILAELGNWMEQEELVAGVSQIGWRCRSISGRHRQAMKALEMGLLFSGTGPLYTYDVYSVYHCLEITAEQVNIMEMCHSALRKLRGYDQENGTELLATLHAYLTCRSNVSEAAAALYIHRNTLAKRLERINDLVHLDYSDAETIFHLLFSYRILEYYGATRVRISYEDWTGKMPTLRHP